MIPLPSSYFYTFEFHSLFFTFVLFFIAYLFYKEISFFIADRKKMNSINTTNTNIEVFNSNSNINIVNIFKENQLKKLNDIMAKTNNNINIDHNKYLDYLDELIINSFYHKKINTNY